MRFLKQVVLLCFAFFFVSLPLKAQGSNAAAASKPDGSSGLLSSLEWFVRGSLFFFPEDNGNASAPMPILPTLGGGVSYAINDLLAVEASLDIYGTTYDYDYDLNRAVPASDEHRSAFVIGAVLGFQPVFRFKPKGDAFTIRAYGGAAFDLRIIFSAYGIEDDEQHSTDPNGVVKTVGQARSDISSYFWSDGRFFLPFIGGGMDFPVLDVVQLGFDVRAWFPAWKLWSGEDLPAIEGWRFGIGFRVTF